ncbi:MAG: hypothetical protein JW791_05050 [Nanoarchaeota archaeon]|nr:hypothetical protein [Nanoarchaeota archaeon]
MKRVYFFLMIAVLILGCTAQEEPETQSQTSLQRESRCASNEDLCIIGTPGLLNRDGVYSSSDTFFSLVLRNNLQGQEAKNVEIQLKNVGPFKIVEGFTAIIENDSCRLEVGVWGPHIERDITNSPNPQFVDDLGLPFAKHKLNVMYPNEEVEFTWRLRAPSFQEIADVAYEHSFDYVVSYDYSSGILQTVYAISESEYQRQLSITGNEPSTTGTITGSVGALSIASNVQEPVRVQNIGSQFSLLYQIQNQRTGTPTNPAMFLLQYPEGLRFVGDFVGTTSLEEFGYIDLMSAVRYYNGSDAGFEGGICIPVDYDEDSEIIPKTHYDGEGYTIFGNQLANNTCSLTFKSVTLSNLLAYIREEFPDLIFDEQQPRLVIKFLYPNDLKDEVNYLYFPMEVRETINISKYYTFRLKTKYRYSFSGEDDILIVPNIASFESETETGVGFFWGDMTPNLQFLADTERAETPDRYFYDSGSNSLTIDLNTPREDIELISKVKRLANYNFLHVISLNSNEEPRRINCEQDSDCDLFYCNPSDNLCYFDDAYIRVIEVPNVYSMDVGYYTGDSRINKILSTDADYYKIDVRPLVFFNEYPYPGGDEEVGAQRESVSEHELSFTVSTLEDLAENIDAFVKNKAFFEVRNAEGIILSDSDKIGFTLDTGSYERQRTTIPDNLKIINYYDNETYFEKLLSNGNSIIGAYTSQTSLQSSQLLFYFFNNDGVNHFLDYNISMLNATIEVGKVRVTPLNIVRKYTNAFSESYSAEDYPYTKNAPAGMYLLKSRDFDYGSDYLNCGINGDNIKPVIVISYRDEVRTIPFFDEVESYEDGRIIIGDYVDCASMNLVYGIGCDKVTFVRGVVNLCAAKG